MKRKDCYCYEDEKPTNLPKCKLAHAYVPDQVLGEVYDPKKALCRGTIFPELDMPYEHEKRKHMK